MLKRLVPHLVKNKLVILSEKCKPQKRCLYNCTWPERRLKISWDNWPGLPIRSRDSAFLRPLKALHTYLGSVGPFWQIDVTHVRQPLAVRVVEAGVDQGCCWAGLAPLSSSGKCFGFMFAFCAFFFTFWRFLLFFLFAFKYIKDKFGTSCFDEDNHGAFNEISMEESNQLLLQINL